jgi:hypothetical protein
MVSFRRGPTRCGKWVPHLVAREIREALVGLLDSPESRSPVTLNFKSWQKALGQRSPSPEV